MKLGITCILYLILPFAAIAQDVIILKDSTRIQAKVLEINPDDIRYKEAGNPDGPVITIVRSTVAGISYPNGYRTTFNTKSAGNSTKKTTEKNAHLHRVYAAVGLDMGVCNVTSNDHNYSTSASVYFAEAIMVTKMANDHIGTQFGFAYNSCSYNLNYYFGSPRGNTSDFVTLNYLTLPLRTLYFSNSKKRAGFYGSFGFDISFLMAASNPDNDNFYAYYKPVMMNLYVSGGIQFRTKSANSVWMFGPFYKTTAYDFYSGIAGNGGLAANNNGKLSDLGLTVTFLYDGNVGQAGKKGHKVPQL